jgi:hypothetical protein
MNIFIENLAKINRLEINWLCNELNKKTDLLEISYGYQDLCEYDGNIMKALDCAMFEAYTFYRNKTPISAEDALYLKNRDGILGFNYNEESDEKPIILTVKNLIHLYEGNELFHKWLCDSSINEFFDDISDYL